MPEEPFRNREILEMFSDLRDSNIRIEAKVDKTNGRVTNLERWQYTFIGAISVLTLIVVPLLGWALYVLSNINDTVHKSVDEALSAYNIEK